MDCIIIAFVDDVLCTIAVPLQEAVCSEHVHELSKHKEEIGSLNIRLKWAQNKLKTETEAHKVPV